MLHHSTLPDLFNFGTSAQRHGLTASSPGYEPPVSFEEGCMFLRIGEEILLLSPPINPRFLCPPAVPQTTKFLLLLYEYVCFK